MIPGFSPGKNVEGSVEGKAGGEATTPAGEVLKTSRSHKERNWACPRQKGVYYQDWKRDLGVQH